MTTRLERDSLGELPVPAEALYGAQTARAVRNFPISGTPMPRRFLWALGLVKRSCARVNRDLGHLDPRIADAIAAAADEMMAGVLDEHFPVDVYQTGSGTSSNMNANEVLANRAAQRLGLPLGTKAVHPNDHVNLGQSSNDVIPTALHVAGAVALHEDLVPALRHLAATLRRQSEATMWVVKSGRTHLMDATPVTLGQELGGHATQVDNAARRAEAARDALLELALGGTAVGTGLNAPAGLATGAIAAIAEATGLSFVEAPDHFEAQGAQDGVVEAHGHLSTIAGSLNKIANDLRWLGSGPRTGLYEVRLPAIQPGSSIMPGKVNPVLCEMITMVAARVAGNQTTVGICGMGGNFELNTYLPLLAHALLESVTLLANGARVFADGCVAGLEANEQRCRETVERNLSIGTVLNPAIGYDAAAELVKKAFAEGRNLRDVARESGLLDDDELDRLLDPLAMTGLPPG